MTSLKYDLGDKQPAVPLDSWVLVTGVTGLIGGHIADKLLEVGYKVKGVSRNAQKAQWTADLFNKKYGSGRYEIAEVSDMGKPHAYADVLKGVQGVIHAASDLSMSPDPNEIIPPTIKHIQSILSDAATDLDIKRFVYTSSSTAMILPKPNENIKVTTETWNEEAVETAWAPPPYKAERGFAVYGASKKQGEEAVWTFVKEKKPPFTVNTVLPNANFGRQIHPSQNNSTAGWPASVYKSGKADKLRATVPPQWFVDVEDDALVHVAALIDPSVANERILAFGEPFNWSRVLGVYKHLAPGKQFEAPDENEPKDLMEIPNERGAELLRKFNRHGWTSLEESLKGRMQQDLEALKA